MRGRNITNQSFCVKLHIPNKVVENIKTKVVIEPDKAEFIDYAIDKVNLVRLSIRNQSKKTIDFHIVQPHKTNLEVKCKPNQIMSKQTIELHILFNPQQQTNSIDDYFIVKFDKDDSEIHVPIICVYKPPSTNNNINSKNNVFNKQNTQLELEGIFISSLLQRKNQVHQNIRQKKVSIGSKIRKQSRYIQMQMKEELMEQFQKRFVRISQYLKQKYVKNQIYLGQKPITRARLDEINNFNTNLQKLQIATFKKRLKQRYLISYEQSGPVIQTFTNITLKWSYNRNIPQLIFQKGLLKIQEEVRKYIMNYRFDKIKNSLKCYKSYRQKQKNQQKKLQMQQYVYNLNNKLEKINKTNEFDFNFNKNSMHPTQLEVEYIIDYQQKHFTYQINQRIQFDHWIPMIQLKLSFQEIYCFSYIQPKEGLMDFSILETQNKTGAFHEYPYKNVNDPLTTQQIGHIVNQTQQIIQNKQQLPHFKLNVFKNTLRIYRNNADSNNQILDICPQQIQSVAKILPSQQDSFSILNNIKCYQQNNQPYFQLPSLSPLQMYIHIQHSNNNNINLVIGAIRKQDTIREKEAQQPKYKYMVELIKNLEENQSFSNGKINDLIEIIPINLIKNEKIYEKLMQTIETIKFKKQSQCLTRLLMFNNLIKNQQNKLLL